MWQKTLKKNILTYELTNKIAKELELERFSILLEKEKLYINNKN